MYGQVTLTFRYGREDEEVMGLKFCNEAVMCLAQLYPPYSGADYQENMSSLQVSTRKDGNNEIMPLILRINHPCVCVCAHTSN